MSCVQICGPCYILQMCMALEQLEVHQSDVVVIPGKKFRYMILDGIDEPDQRIQEIANHIPEPHVSCDNRLLPIKQQRPAWSHLTRSFHHISPHNVFDSTNKSGNQLTSQSPRNSLSCPEPPVSLSLLFSSFPLSSFQSLQRYWPGFDEFLCQPLISATNSKSSPHTWPTNT